MEAKCAIVLALVVGIGSLFWSTDKGGSLPPVTETPRVEYDYIVGKNIQPL